MDELKDLKSQLRAAKEEQERRDEEIRVWRERQTKSEAALKAWRRVSAISYSCYEEQERGIAATIDAIHAAIYATELAGELAHLRSVADHWLNRPTRFSLPARITAAIVNKANDEQAAELLRDAVGQQMMTAVADYFDELGTLTYQKTDLAKYYPEPTLSTGIQTNGPAAAETALPTGAATPSHHAVAENQSAIEDGPLKDRKAFCHGCQTYSEDLEPIAWRFIKATYWRRGEFINGRDLLRSVWNRDANPDVWAKNPDSILNEKAAKDVVYKVNKFFRRHNLPFHAEQNALSGSRMFALADGHPPAGG